MATLLRKFGSSLKPAFFDRVLRASESTLLTEKVIPAVKGDLVSEACYAAVALYCSGNRQKARGFASKCIEYAEDYFFGEWRSQVRTDEGTVGPAWWRREMPWVDRFRYSVCWALALGRLQSAQRMAQYPDKDSWAKDLDERDAFYSLACFIRGEPANFAGALNAAKASSKEKPRLIAALVMSLMSKDHSSFQKALEEYLAFFRREEFNPNNITTLLCLDGTTLINLGKLQGFDFQIPPEVTDHIIQV